MNPVFLTRFIVAFSASIAMLVAGNVIRSFQNGAAPVRAVDFPFIEHWKISHFFFNYHDLGFEKRSLVGTVFNMDPGLGLSLKIVLLVSAVVLAVTVLLAALIARADNATLGWAAILSPAIFLQMGYDLGRFDQFSTLLLLLFVMSNRGYFIFLMIPSLFIHEGSLLTHIPVAALIYYVRYGYNPQLAVFAGLSLVSVAGIVLFATGTGAEDLAALYPTASPDSLGVLDQDAKVMIYVAAMRILHIDLQNFVLFALAGAYLAALGLLVLRIEGFRLAGFVQLLVLISPIYLCPVALDFPRWIGLACFNILLFLIVIHGRDGLRLPGAYRYIGGVALLGPVGVFFPFPLLGLAIDALTG